MRNRFSSEEYQAGCDWRTGVVKLEVAPSAESLRRKGRHGVFAGKTVWSMPEHFDIYIVYKRRYINTFPFLCSRSLCDVVQESEHVLAMLTALWSYLTSSLVRVCSRWRPASQDTMMKWRALTVTAVIVCSLLGLWIARLCSSTSALAR